jgi:hypothetical protein
MPTWTIHDVVDLATYSELEHEVRWLNTSEMLPYIVTNSVALAWLPTSSARASPQKITLTGIGS